MFDKLIFFTFSVPQWTQISAKWGKFCGNVKTIKKKTIWKSIERIVDPFFKSIASFQSKIFVAKNEGSYKFYPRIIVTREDHFFRLGKNTDLMWRPCFSGIVTTLIKLRSTVKRRLFWTSVEYAYEYIVIDSFNITSERR